MIRLGMYLRISFDPTNDSTAPERQREDCENWAKRELFEIVEVFEDRDTSAYNKKVTRPGFERLLTAIHDGQVNAVVAWKTDRLVRQHRDMARLADALEDCGGFLVGYADGVDTRSQGGRLVYSIMASIAREESATMSMRLKRKHQELAERGMPKGGGRRAFGYTLHMEVVPEEAALIREVATRLLENGESLRSVVANWWKRGITTSYGHQWTAVRLRDTLVSPHLSGQREHHGGIVPATWEPILAPEITSRLVARFSARAAPRGRGRVYLLTGLVYCGRCGSKLVGTSKGRNEPPVYACRRTTPNACGGLTRHAGRVEESVRRQLADANANGLLARRVAAINASDDGEEARLLASIRDANVLLDELNHDRYSPDARMGREEYLRARAPLAERIEADTKRLRTIGRDAFPVDAGTFDAEWQSKSIEWRRIAVESAVERVIVKPASQLGARAFVNEDVVLVWR